MIQHPVVEGFEPDADILSIHIARIPNSARHARILFQRPVETRGLQTTSVRLRNRACETRKTNMALTSPWGPSINRVLGRTPRRYVRSSRGPRLNRGLQPVQQRRGFYPHLAGSSTRKVELFCGGFWRGFGRRNRSHEGGAVGPKGRLRGPGRYAGALYRGDVGEAGGLPKPPQWRPGPLSRFATAPPSWERFGWAPAFCAESASPCPIARC